MKNTNLYKLYNSGLPCELVNDGDIVADILHELTLTPGASIEISEATNYASLKLFGKYVVDFEVTEEIAGLLLKVPNVTISEMFAAIIPHIEEVNGKYVSEFEKSKWLGK